jgi:MFS family permease
VLLVVLANTWIDTDPDGLARAAGAIVLTTIAGGAIWCGLWALLSKTFTRQSHFGWHVRVFVIASLVTLALAVLPPLVAFAFSWPWVTDFSFIAVYATVAGAIYFHLLAVEPARERLMRGVAATGFVVGVALTLWFNVQRTGRPGEELYMNHLFPPQLRLARTKPVDSLIESLTPVQAILDRKAKEQSGGDSDLRGGDDEE